MIFSYWVERAARKPGPEKIIAPSERDAEEKLNNEGVMSFLKLFQAQSEEEYDREYQKWKESIAMDSYSGSGKLPGR